jgi:hypothetical protein
MGVLEGMSTKRDIVTLLSSNFPFVGALEEQANIDIDTKNEIH